MSKFIAGVAVGIVAAGAMTAAIAQVAVSVPSNGVLAGYIVQDRQGREVCRNPSVYNQFRGPESYILCNQSR